MKSVKKPSSKTTSTKKPAASRLAAKKPAAKKMATKKPAARADLGAPIDGFFTKQPPAIRAICDALRALIDSVVPHAESSLKWGMPFYTLNGQMMCALGAHKAHVNLILSGPQEAFVDPKGRLEGTGKTGRHLKVTDVKDLPKAEIRAWLKTAAALAKRAT